MAGGREQGVFISYRRADTRADAGRLCDRLTERFGGGRVFMDIDDIAPGEDFQAILRDTLDSCRVLLVLIGPAWLDSGDGAGRLAEAGDFVRLEVATALQRGIPVIPVLFNRARMPLAEQLPRDLQDLVSRQALEVSDSRFHRDADHLVEVLEPLLGASPATTLSRRSLLGIVTGAILVVALGGWWLAAPDLRPEAPVTVAEGQPVVALAGLREQPVRVREAELQVLLEQHGFFDSVRHAKGQGSGAALALSLVDDDAVVIDSRTGLMWQQNYTGVQRNFDSAQQQVTALNAKRFAGHTDWRLPTLVEAMSLLSPGEQAGEYVSPLLSGRDTSILWTADWASDQSRWVVYTHSGTAALETAEFNAWVRAVRRAR